MDLLRIAARVAGLSQPVSDRPDYGRQGQQEETGVVEKTPGKGYCVRSEKNPDWKGGCYPSKGEADDRLKQVEKFKHMKGSLDLGEKDLAIVLSAGGRAKVFLGGRQVGLLSRALFSASSDSSPESYALLSFMEGVPASAGGLEDNREVFSSVRSVASALRDLPFVYVSTPEDPVLSGRPGMGAFSLPDGRTAEIASRRRASSFEDLAAQMDSDLAGRKDRHDEAVERASRRGK